MTQQTVNSASPDTHPQGSRDGLALSLSGGGYRAMMYHVGALWRLNEVGLLGRIARISSVSGGSITAAALGVHWEQLGFVDGRSAHFEDFVATMRKMAAVTIDVGAVIGGVLLPGDVSSRVAGAYAKVLFGKKTLQDLPDDAAGKGPRIVLNATNIQTGALWRFSRPYMADYRVGMVMKPQLSLADAVAASSAFPPILSPATIVLDQPVLATPGADLSRAPFTDKAILSDGGVYDNLGLETVKQYHTLLVSDGGQKIAAEEAPAHDWVRHAVRVLDVIDNQVRSLRVRHLIDAYERKIHEGCYWGIRGQTRLAAALPDPLGTRTRDPSKWAAIPTRLERMPLEIQNGLINWGYAACDIALRSWFNQGAERLGVFLNPPEAFPVPDEY